MSTQREECHLLNQQFLLFLSKSIDSIKKTKKPKKQKQNLLSDFCAALHQYSSKITNIIWKKYMCLEFVALVETNTVPNSMRTTF